MLALRIPKIRATEKGFTLIELLVVIAIIAVLGSFAFVAFDQARINARSTRRLSDLKMLQKAVELYFSDYGSYPSTSGAWRYDCYSGTTYYNNYIPNITEYIPKLPHDPKSKCLGNLDYNYAYISNGTNYKILAPQVPNKRGGIENCSYGVDHGVDDPARPCQTSGDPAWAAFSPGAAAW